MKKIKLIIFLSFFNSLFGVFTGLDVFMEEKKYEALAGKKVGVVTNHTAVNRKMIPITELFTEKKIPFTVVAFFSPEHGLRGAGYAAENIKDSVTIEGVPIHSLHGSTRRPTSEMLKGIDILIYDIQDVGVRTYTYATTLYYVMEEAAKKGIKVIVLDRPNPLGGEVVDGTMLLEKWRSFIGYINVPVCHGMTIGELATFFNKEYAVKCDLQVVKMRGWKRKMAFPDTKLPWIPTSPHIPEADTPLYYATTGGIGETGIVNIGIGYTLPFKVVGAQWIDAELFAKKLNEQHLSGVTFVPFHYKPYYGMYAGKECHGALIRITDHTVYRPCSTQFALLGILKSLYPDKVSEKLTALTASQKDLFCKAMGTDQVLSILKNEKYATWKLIGHDIGGRDSFSVRREAYLFGEYR